MSSHMQIAVWLSAGGPALALMRLQGPHAAARLALPQALRCAPLAAPEQAAGFAPEFLERAEATVQLDAAAVRVLATQVGQTCCTRQSSQALKSAPAEMLPHGAVSHASRCGGG